MTENSTAQLLVENRVASRIGEGDSSLYDFDENAQDFAKNFMGWRDLATNPPVSAGSIEAFVKQVRNDGLNNIVLLGQGGSMTSASVSSMWS